MESIEMTSLQYRIQNVLLEIDREFRSPVAKAFKQSDGSYLSFQEELSSMAWDYPSLPVQSILDKIAYDLA
jgi:hypothetical protein